MWIDDDMLGRCAEPLAISCWIPDKSLVVLGSSNVAEKEVEVDLCAEAGIPILKRYGGGGTVLLHGGCVVVSVGAWVQQLYQNKLYFQRLNQALIEALAAAWPGLSALTQLGLSDIVFGNRKVAGTSLFRSRNYLLYQASLLVDPRTELVEKYLKHPTKEPDYRSGRSHGAFLTGLALLVPGVDAAACLKQIASSLPETVVAQLGDELVQPVPSQFSALEMRRQRG